MKKLNEPSSNRKNESSAELRNFLSSLARTIKYSVRLVDILKCGFSLDECFYFDIFLLISMRIENRIKKIVSHLSFVTHIECSSNKFVARSIYIDLRFRHKRKFSFFNDVHHDATLIVHPVLVGDKMGMFLLHNSQVNVNDNPHTQSLISIPWRFVPYNFLPLAFYLFL